MKYLAKILIFTFSIYSMACVPSLNPLYTEQDLIDDDSIVGSWIDKEAEERWVFSTAGKMEYKLVQIAEDRRSGEFSARLLRVGDEVFMDIVPIKTGFAQSAFFQDQLLATHTFVHIKKNGHRIFASVLEPKWLKQTVTARRDAVRHEKVSGEVLLTASPKELQTFLISNLRTRGAFSEPSELIRMTSSSPADQGDRQYHKGFEALVSTVDDPAGRASTISRITKEK